MHVNALKLHQAFLRRQQRAVFQTASALISSLIDCGKYDLIIILTILQLMTAGMARRMQMRYAVEVVGYVGYDITLHYLLMINIIYHLDQRMIDLAYYLEALNRRPQIVAGMVEISI